ncbi:hypothetical protein ACH4UM_15965 [Streptomyces sp. NPDC020801]|uniref:hypothetical protein n=1 Tax=unclassified Streptomyces TaxID=2593676 RepID=UPI00378FB390
MGRWVLLVVPPGEAVGAAARLLAAAGPRNPLTAARMPALTGTGRLPETVREAE